MIFHENRLLAAGRRFSCNIIHYFCRKLGKMSQTLSSAAVVIGALRVKQYHSTYLKPFKSDNFAISEDPDEMQHNAAFNQRLYLLL